MPNAQITTFVKNKVMGCPSSMLAYFMLEALTLYEDERRLLYFNLIKHSRILRINIAQQGITNLCLFN